MLGSHRLLSTWSLGSVGFVLSLHLVSPSPWPTVPCHFPQAHHAQVQWDLSPDPGKQPDCRPAAPSVISLFASPLLSAQPAAPTPELPGPLSPLPPHCWDLRHLTSLAIPKPTAGLSKDPRLLTGRQRPSLKSYLEVASLPSRGTRSSQGLSSSPGHFCGAMIPPVSDHYCSTLELLPSVRVHQPGVSKRGGGTGTGWGQRPTQYTNVLHTVSQSHSSPMR